MAVDKLSAPLLTFSQMSLKLLLVSLCHYLMVTERVQRTGGNEHSLIFFIVIISLADLTAGYRVADLSLCSQQMIHYLRCHLAEHQSFNVSFVLLEATREGRMERVSQCYNVTELQCYYVRL